MIRRSHRLTDVHPHLFPLSRTRPAGLHRGTIFSHPVSGAHFEVGDFVVGVQRDMVSAVAASQAAATQAAAGGDGPAQLLVVPVATPPKIQTLHKMVGDPEKFGSDKTICRGWQCVPQTTLPLDRSEQKCWGTKKYSEVYANIMSKWRPIVQNRALFAHEINKYQVDLADDVAQGGAPVDAAGDLLPPAPNAMTVDQCKAEIDLRGEMEQGKQCRTAAQYKGLVKLLRARDAAAAATVAAGPSAVGPATATDAEVVAGIAAAAPPEYGDDDDDNLEEDEDDGEDMDADDDDAAWNTI